MINANKQQNITNRKNEKKMINMSRLININTENLKKININKININRGNLR